jgi:hypothetical protein
LIFLHASQPSSNPRGKHQWERLILRLGEQSSSWRQTAVVPKRASDGWSLNRHVPPLDLDTLNTALTQPTLNLSLTFPNIAAITP